MIKKVEVSSIPVFFLKERTSFVAYSPVVDVTTCGRTLEEAKTNFTEALDIFFEECTAMGTLEKVLESLGWEKKRGQACVLAFLEKRRGVHHQGTKTPRGRPRMIG